MANLIENVHLFTGVLKHLLVTFTVFVPTKQIILVILKLRANIFSCCYYLQRIFIAQASLSSSMTSLHSEWNMLEQFLYSHCEVVRVYLTLVQANPGAWKVSIIGTPNTTLPKPSLIKKKRKVSTYPLSTYH